MLSAESLAHIWTCAGHQYDGAIMITASHLPFHRNGFKFFTKDGGAEKVGLSEGDAPAARIGATLMAAACASLIFAPHHGGLDRQQHANCREETLFCTPNILLRSHMSGSHSEGAAVHAAETGAAPHHLDLLSSRP